MSRRTRKVLFIVGGVAVATAVVLLGLYLASQHKPGFYNQAMAVDPATMEKHSDQMLQRAAALASAVTKDAHWEAVFTAEQINGWLAVDMVKNHPKALPPGLHDPRVSIDSRRITIACRLDQGLFSSVLSLTVEPYVPVPEQNLLLLRIVNARAGLLPAPLKRVLDGLAQAARDMHLQLQWRNVRGDPVAMFSAPPSADKRTVTIESLRLEDGKIYVSGSTQTKSE
jgi:hypothetical protein